MVSRKYFPKPPLAGFIQCLWYWEGAPGPHTKERLLPNGEPAIIFNLRNEPIRIYDAQNIALYESYGNAVLSGARANCFVIDTCQQERVIGIQFRPGGAFPFFGFPASETTNASFCLEDLWPRRVGEIREQLLAAQDVDAMFAVLERSLRAQLARPLELHPAVAYALDSFNGSAHVCTIAAVTERTGFSSRRFIELFHSQVGLTPKAFCRVRRFQRVLCTVHRRQQVDWAQVALACGFYDQAHLIHDFRAFSGFTPAAYLAAATPHLNHVSLR
ncbi:MAG: helix-turn-helix domain-containing protein [Bryobacteraceae bacterium]